MPQGPPGPADAPRRRSLLRSPFLWAGLGVIAVLGAILAVGGSGGKGDWPAALYLPEDGILLSPARFRAEPGGPVLDLDWASSTTSTSVTAGEADTVTAFEGEWEIFRPAKDPVRKFLYRLGPLSEPTRVYATTGEVVEADGRRWYLLLPE